MTLELNTKRPAWNRRASQNGGFRSEDYYRDSLHCKRTNGGSNCCATVNRNLEQPGLCANGGRVYIQTRARPRADAQRDCRAFAAETQGELFSNHAPGD